MITDHCEYVNHLVGKIVDIIINGKRCFCVFTVHFAKVNYTRFSKVSSRNIFIFFQPEPELVLKLFLIFGQSEPHSSYEVILIKKVCIYLLKYNQPHQICHLY